MAFFLTHVWKMVVIGYPIWMVNMIHKAQQSGKNIDDHEHAEEKKEEEAAAAKKAAHH
jgi:hypothetical protein